MDQLLILAKLFLQGSPHTPLVTVYLENFIYQGIAFLI
jgi:hypothetical protein